MKLHLGCGERYLEGYIHIDLGDYDHLDYQIPVDDLSVFENNSINEIYASHVIEYFDRDEIKILLKEWNRVLVDGGVLRLAVPNFENLIKVYELTGSIDDILGPLYGKWHATNETTIYHKTVYDKKTLTKVLEDATFKEVREWDWQSVFASINYDDHSQAYFPHMDKKNGIHVSLNLECIK
tara:strand:- start:398 stop:940 length:543 start_codon:yes stop_codon:yes gene_type:complete